MLASEETESEKERGVGCDRKRQPNRERERTVNDSNLKKITFSPKPILQVTSVSNTRWLSDGNNQC